jgi:D-alanine-D-alanine ligase
MKIGMTYNLKSDWQLSDGDMVDGNAEFDKPETIEDIAAILTSLGHQVMKIGNVQNLFAQIATLDVDIVFNIHEGIGDRNRESQVPIVLDLHNIPFTGSDALTLGITLDKMVAKKCFIADDVPTPRYFVASEAGDIKKLKHVAFPLMVKTMWEGTSKGLSENSRVENVEQLQRQIEFVVKQYKQPALVEEFISGTEFTVGVIGNENPQAMPVVQVSIDGTTELGDHFYTFERTQGNDVRYVCPANISTDLTKKIQEIAVAAYRSVGCRDYGRVDFRVDQKGQPYVLEINPLPSLDRKDVFNLFPKVIGATFEDMIAQILKLALKRYGLSDGDSCKSAAVSQVSFK